MATMMRSEDELSVNWIHTCIGREVECRVVIWCSFQHPNFVFMSKHAVIYIKYSDVTSVWLD